MTRIAVDFDGTLCEETWPKLGPWLSGAVDALKRLASMFDEVVIFTCRVAEFEMDETTPRDNTDQLLALYYRLGLEELPKNIYVWTKPWKPQADFYVDDKAVRFEGDWLKTLSEIAVKKTTNRTIHAPFACQCGGMLTPGCAGYQAETNQEVIVEESPGQKAMREYRESIIPPEYDDLCPPKQIRLFETGATRDSSEGKPSYASYLSPLVLKSFGEYMLRHEVQANGERREPGNWKKGMPKQAYIESLFRHALDLWLTHDGYGREAREPMIEALNAILFNASGYLHVLLEDFYLDSGDSSGMLGEGNQPEIEGELWRS